MKRSIFSLLFCVILTTLLMLPTSATKTPSTSPEGILLFRTTDSLDDGWTIFSETKLISQSITATASTKTTSTTKTITYNGVTVGIFTIQATFQYNGSTVSVTSKSVTRADTYSGWSYTQTSFTSSGGTVTLNGKLTKLLHPSLSFSMSLSCDKNGNITTS